MHLYQTSGIVVQQGEAEVKKNNWFWNYTILRKLSCNGNITKWGNRYNGSYFNVNSTRLQFSIIIQTINF